MKCVDCQTENREDSLFCVNCGSRLDTYNAKNKKGGNKGIVILLISIIVMLFIIIGILGYMLYADRNNNSVGKKDKEIKSTSVINKLTGQERNSDEADTESYSGSEISYLSLPIEDPVYYLISEIDDVYSDGSSVHYEFDYDDRGRCMEIRTYSGSKVFRETFEYDSNDNWIKDSHYDENGRLTVETSCIYDQYDRLYKYIYTYNDGMSEVVDTYEYDSEGNNTGITKEYDGKTIYIENKYDRAGNLIEEIGPYSHNRYEYNSFYELTKEMHWGDGEWTTYKEIIYSRANRSEETIYYDGSRSLRLYDDEYRLLSITGTETDGSLYRDEHYTYDSSGNCISIIDTAFKHEVTFKYIECYGEDYDYEEFPVVYDEDKRPGLIYGYIYDENLN